MFKRVRIFYVTISDHKIGTELIFTRLLLLWSVCCCCLECFLALSAKRFYVCFPRTVLPYYCKIALSLGPIVARSTDRHVMATSGGCNIIAPITGLSDGLAKAQVTHGVREVVLCKDQKEIVGLRLRAVNNVRHLLFSQRKSLPSVFIYLV